MAAIGPRANANYRPIPVGPLLGETIRQRTFEAAWRRHTTSDRHPPTTVTTLTNGPVPCAARAGGAGTGG